MKHLASRQVLRLSRTGALALGLGLSALAAPPAAADCSAGPMTMSTGTGASYTCTRNCVATAGGRARIIRTETFSGHGATVSQCLNACTSTLGCTAVSYSVSVETRDGIPFTTVNCVLIGGGEPSTADYTDTRPGIYSGLCYRDPPTGLWRDPRLQIDWRRELRIDQDNLRPGLPGIGVPHSNPNKP